MTDAADAPAARPAPEVPTSPGAALDLRGTRVLVTGASGGIGRGVVARFVAAGAEVVGHHRSPVGAGHLSNLAERLRCPSTPTGGEGPAIVAVRGDLTTPGGPEAIVAAAVERVGSLEVLVNNAGIQPVSSFDDTTVAEWDDVIATNLTAVHLATQAFATHRRRQGGGGAVVHVGSIEGRNPTVGHGHYAASKAAVRMHARAAALELGPVGIRVNVVSPGLIDRPGLDNDWPEGVSRWEAAAPLGRLGQPADIGDACVALASPLFRWVTGAELVVDGGVSAGPTW